MRSVALSLLLLVSAASSTVPVAVRAQTPDPDTDAIRRSLGEALSFATFGAISGLGPEAEVTREGDSYRIHMPVTGLIAPSDPAVTATARPVGNGAWDVESLNFPTTATIDATGPAAGKLTYTIGSQDITAHIVPDLNQPTTYTARFGDIRLDSEAADQHAQQTIARYAIKGTITGEGDGRIALTSTGEVSDWNVTTMDGQTPGVAFRTRRVTVDAAVQGLDKAKTERLRGRLQTLLADLPKPGQAPGPSAMDPHETLTALLDDATGLLSRFEVNETLEGVRFNHQDMEGGAGSVIIGMHGDTANQSLDAGIDLAVNDVSVPASVAGPYAAYIPKHVSLRNRIHGVPTDQLAALLRAALAENPDEAELQSQAWRLLSTPGASISIDPFSFDSGPLALTGTANLVPAPDGQFGGRVHIVASGMDAMIAQASKDPAFGQVLPMLYLAKGMGKPNGATLVWDIDLGQGGVRINGAPLGPALGHGRSPGGGDGHTPRRR